MLIDHDSPIWKSERLTLEIFLAHFPGSSNVRNHNPTILLNAQIFLD